MLGRKGLKNRRFFSWSIPCFQKKHVLTIDKFGTLQEHKTLRSFCSSKRLFDRSQNFKNIEGETITAMLLNIGKNLLILE